MLAPPDRQQCVRTNEVAIETEKNSELEMEVASRVGSGYCYLERLFTDAVHNRKHIFFFFFFFRL